MHELLIIYYIDGACSINYIDGCIHTRELPMHGWFQGTCRSIWISLAELRGYSDF